MGEWADARGFDMLTLSEHHGSPDGYLPSPLVFGAAVAARTKNLRLVIAALIAPLHDPIAISRPTRHPLFSRRNLLGCHRISDVKEGLGRPQFRFGSSSLSNGI